MKKFALAVSNVCHENWDGMAPEEKGRFCSSCKKTVVDFSSMTDRQLSEFFTKPVGSLCGRFHNDQLNRAISMPNKGATWLKPFFHLTWPAFLLMLKATAQKEKSNETGIENSTIAKMPMVTSAVYPKIKPVEPGERSPGKNNATEPKVLRTSQDTLIKGKVVTDTLRKDTQAEKKEPVIMGMVSFQSYKEKKEKERKEQLRKENETH